MGGMLVPAEAFAATKKVAQTKVAKTKKTITVSAIPGADEKNFDDTATRCLTKEMKTLHAKTLAQLEVDAKKKGEGHAAALTTYKDKIDTVWSAMEQPYCGFGSRGMVAVKHSYLKSIERIRAEFLAAAK